MTHGSPTMVLTKTCIVEGSRGPLQPSWHRGARGRDTARQAVQRRPRDREDDRQGQAGRLEGAGAKLVRDGRRALLQGTGRPAQARAPPPAPSRLLCRSSRSLPFTRTCLVVIQILGNGRSSYLEASPGLTPAFPTQSFRGLSPSFRPGPLHQLSRH